jgi:hypothetical protein
MIASSATVMSNLAYLIGAVVLAAIGGFVVWLFHRQPKSVDATMESFRRGLDVIAPEGFNGSANTTDLQAAIRVESGGLAKVKVDPSPYPLDPRGGFPPLAEDATGGPPGSER